MEELLRIFRNQQSNEQTTSCVYHISYGGP